MKLRLRLVLAFASIGALATCAAVVGQDMLDSTDVDDRRFQPSASSATFDSGRYRDFADYVAQTRARLERDKVYMDASQKKTELEAATPFELSPADGCATTQNGRYGKGILLIHGLSDTPLAMRDLAHAFAERCFLVRVILLPGHGTRAADLLQVTGDDWRRATRFGLATLKTAADKVFVGGFSLGGLLAVHAAVEDPDIDGVFSFSPALSLERGWLLRQSLWLRHIVDWVDRDPPDDYARYESMPFNGLAETYELSERLAQRLGAQELRVPIFIAQSADDRIIDQNTNLDFFKRYFTHPDSRLISYRSDSKEGPDSTDRRISYFNSYLPNERIANFSHMSIHVSPFNPHYGINGDYRNCGISSGDRQADAIERCQSAKWPWRGETVRNNSSDIPDVESMARLTFNPRFDELLGEIDRFLLRLDQGQS